LPGNKTLSGIKSKEHQGRGYNELLFDDTPNQVRAKLSSEHGKTQLNQGYLTHPRRSGQADARGEGFELRTDLQGAIRAAQGLLLTTEAQANAAGKHLARDAAQTQLDAALSLSKSLGQTASGQLADSVETGPSLIQSDNSPGGKAGSGHMQHLSDALKAWENGSNTAKDANSEQPGRQPILVLSSPAGIASVTEQSQALTAGANLDLVAQRDTNQTSGRRWIHNVAEHISLFVKGVKGKVSLKLLAATGTIQVQAQSGDIETTASQDIKITACNGKVTITAAKEILLASGGGYVRIAGGNIETHCPGTVSIKGASKVFAGPTSQNPVMPAMPAPADQASYSGKLDASNHIVDMDNATHAGYKVVMPDKSIHEGTTDFTGSTARFSSDSPGTAKVLVGGDDWQTVVDHNEPLGN
jgi:type VI secretion system secreted protein VgrG